MISINVSVATKFVNFLNLEKGLLAGMQVADQ